MTDSASEEHTPSNWNVPNALTMLRIFLVPVYGWALLSQAGESIQLRWVAFAIFFVAMITDKIDGDLARSRGLVTDFGKIADPIADKAMTGMAMVGLAILHPVFPPWLWWTMTVVVLVREWGITLARLSVAKSVVLAAAWSGKVKTVVQSFALAGLTAPFGMTATGLGVVGEVLWWLAALLLVVAVTLTITSGVEFLRAVRQHQSATS